MIASNEISRTAQISRTAILQTSAISFFALTLALVVNQFRSDRLPLLSDWSPEASIKLKFGKHVLISLDEAKDKFFSGAATFIDARPPELYTKGHIQGALNLPIAKFDQMTDQVLMNLPEDALIVTYCDGEDCSLSAELAR